MIGRFDTIFWDIDGTLLDFEASEAISLRMSLAKQGAQASEEQYELYKQINKRYWQRLERGEVTREALYPGRFADWFDAIGLTGLDPARMNEDYQVALGDTPVLRPGSMEVLRMLKLLCRQYAATNGSIVAQENKLRKSGIIDILDGAFISERMGIPKPDKRYFDACAREIPNYDPNRTVIIGDSLTSDMLGGKNAGIACIWFNPENLPASDDIPLSATVKTIGEIPDVLKRI